MKNIYFENNNKYFQVLLDLISKYPKCYINQLKSKKYSYILNWINQQLPKLQDDFYSLSTKVYWILNGLIDFPYCKICGKQDNYIKKNIIVARGYFNVCSKKCAARDNNRQEKIKNTNIKKYGVENVFQNKKIKEKSVQSRLQSIGVAYPSQSKKIFKKIKQTCFDKYGDENYNNRDKARQTCIDKYGVDNPLKNSGIRKKLINTNLEKYGTEYGLSNKKIIKKIQKTCLKKYNCISYLGSAENVKNIKLKAYKCLFENKDDFPLFSFEDYQMRSDDHAIFRFKCKHCGNEFLARHHDGYHQKCEKCFPGIQCGRSQSERNIFEFLKTIYTGNIYSGSRSVIYPLELDIYIPDLHIAVEFDGLYWHAENNSKNSKTYHLNKTKACEEKGIRLVHIFENEWVFKQDIVKSRLKNLLGIYDKTIYARKCRVEEIDNKISWLFQNQNHIQGSVNASVNLGLYDKDELVSIMTFGKCRFDKKHEWEMLRFCNKLGHHIPGAGGKLLRYFEKYYCPKSLTTYADRRWSQGGLYRKLGFSLSHISPPDYWYFKKNSLELESRIKFQKHKLNDNLPIFDKTMTEAENMMQNGYYRIFDCGNFVFEKNYSNSKPFVS